jgi:hypothetical protein
LDAYRETLERQRERLSSDYHDLQHHFEALWSEYGGTMAEEFQHRWGRTAEWFEHYLQTTRDLDRFLEERIEQLRHL